MLLKKMEQRVTDKRGTHPFCVPKDPVWVLVLCIQIQNAIEMHSVFWWSHGSRKDLQARLAKVLRHFLNRGPLVMCLGSPRTESILLCSPELRPNRLFELL